MLVVHVTSYLHQLADMLRLIVIGRWATAVASSIGTVLVGKASNHAFIVGLCIHGLLVVDPLRQLSIKLLLRLSIISNVGQISIVLPRLRLYIDAGDHCILGSGYRRHLNVHGLLE